MGTQAAGTNAVAVGSGASANFANSAAFGSGATATRASQQVFGTASKVQSGTGLLEPDQEAAIILRHVGDDAVTKVERAATSCSTVTAAAVMPLEVRDELGRDVLGTHGQHLGLGPVVARKIDDEGSAQPIIDSERTANIEQVARMLPIEGGDDLAAIEIGAECRPNGC